MKIEIMDLGSINWVINSLYVVFFINYLQKQRNTIKYIIQGQSLTHKFNVHLLDTHIITTLLPYLVSPS